MVNAVYNQKTCELTIKVEDTSRAAHLFAELMIDATATPYSTGIAYTKKCGPRRAQDFADSIGIKLCHKSYDFLHSVNVDFRRLRGLETFYTDDLPSIGEAVDRLKTCKLYYGKITGHLKIIAPSGSSDEIVIGIQAAAEALRLRTTQAKHGPKAAVIFVKADSEKIESLKNFGLEVEEFWIEAFEVEKVTGPLRDGISKQAQLRSVKAIYNTISDLVPVA